MSSMFVSKKAVPVTDGINTIYIKPKMDFGTRNAVIGEAVSVAMVPKEKPGGKRLVKGKRRPNAPKSSDALTHYNVGAYQVALLIHNIVDWKGPDFDDMECTAEAIRSFDPDHPLVKMVQEEIARLNPNPNAEDEEGEGEGDVVEGKSIIAG